MKAISFLFIALIFVAVSCEDNNSSATNATANTTTNTTANTTTNTTATNTTANQTENNGSCNGAFYSSQRFKKWGLVRPSFLAEAKVSSDLTYCKMFNNISSCCDNNTDLQIAAFYEKYKNALTVMTGRRMNKMKNVFEKFKSIDFNGFNLTSNLSGDVLKVSNDIKTRWITVNQEIVSCARASLNLTVGLFCQGCAPNNSNTQLNGKLLLNKNACVALAKGCYKLIESFNKTKNASIDDTMNLTDTMTTFIGEEVASVENSTVIFGNLTDVNLTYNETTRLLDNTNINNNGKGNSNSYGKTKKTKADVTTVLNQSVALVLKAFPSVAKVNFIVCDGSNNSTKCTNHTLLPQFPNQTLFAEIMNRFQLESEWGFWPVYLELNITGKNSNNADTTNTSNSSYNCRLNFLFSTLAANTNLLKFLLGKNHNVAQKLAKLIEFEETMKDALEQFVAFYNTTQKFGADKELVDKDTFRSSDQKLLGCVFAGLIQVFNSVNQTMLNSNCSFNITLGDLNNSKVCNTSVTYDLKPALDKCKQKASTITYIQGICEQNQSCVVCIDNSCFTQTTSFKRVNQEAELEYSKEDGRKQFNTNPKLSLKTGKVLPEFIVLPDFSFLTNFNYTPPCNNISTCSVWFCSKFLRGPAGRLEKLYNPQDSADDDDSETKSYYTNETFTNTSNTSNATRILAETDNEDVTISETGGIDFNALAGQSSLDFSVTIDGVNSSATAYTDTSSNSTDTSTTTGNHGSRGMFNIMVFTIMIILVSFII